MFAPELSWLTGVVRWLHVIAAILWIGTSFHLFSWEYKFNRKTGLRPGVEGNLWMIQGGDFYYVERLRATPEQLPEDLVWFKYEAYLTWLSGFALLVLVYYLNASELLVLATTGIPAPLAIVISIALLPLSWLAYQRFCNSAQAGNLPMSAALGLALVAILSYLLSLIFGGRAAFLHIGVLMGTIMSANVFFVIIPWHKSLIAAIQAGQPLDALYAQHPGVRSDHNHYLALPVIFVMLSGHLPIAYNHPQAWIVLTLCILAAGLIKHAHTLQQQKKTAGGIFYLVLGLSLIVGGALFTRPNVIDDQCGATVTFEQARQIISDNCVSCHSSSPTDRIWRSPPNNIVFDTRNQIYAMRERIRDRVVMTQTMPPMDRAHMRTRDRQQLKCWLDNET